MIARIPCPSVWSELVDRPASPGSGVIDAIGAEHPDDVDSEQAACDVARLVDAKELVAGVTLAAAGSFSAWQA